MNRIQLKFVLPLLVLVTFSVNAQNIKANWIRQITDRKKGEFTISGISPDGRKLLVTNHDYKGLKLLDIRKGTLITISDGIASGYEPGFSADGKYIYFRTDSFSGTRKMSVISQYETLTERTIILTSPGRNLTPPVVTSNGITYSANGKLETRMSGDGVLKSSVPDIVVMLEDLTPVLYINGERRPYKPSGDGNYIWLSLSPDRTKILYCYKGLNTYVSDLYGNILCSAGRLNAPKWINNQLIIGMDDKDDGNRVISSEIVIYSIVTDEKHYLTSSNSRLEMYPFPFPDGKKVAFQTPEGELYIMNIKIR